MASKSKNTEVDAYLFIRDDLKQRGWNTRSPERGGQVYTQNECLAHPEIKAGLGLDKPENVVKVTDSVFWVIEAKREHSKLPVAVHEAKEYAKKINQSQTIKAAFVSGVAGNEDESYLVETFFMVGDEFVPITMNGMAISSLISPDVARTVLGFGPDILDVPVDEKLFLAKAEKINKILHVGAINKNTRARVMAALLLSLADDASLNVDNAPSVLISEINAKALRVLKREGKGEFGSFVELTLPPTEDNHIKYKTALVSTIQELNSINIRSAMNSGTDVLGKFYEVFLKYGNGAKEIGIVLTPRHITQFAVDVVGVTDRDIVYDPTCGTGGFLVAAFDRVKKDCSEADTNRFKATGLFGVEQEPEVVALAIVNMIFRGDGKLNITEGDCFQKQLLPHVSKENGRTARYAKTAPKDTERVVTRTLMNPPFSSPRKEFEFVEQALQQMAGGGVLFAVMPYSAMVKPGAYQLWRKESLLANNTLLSVVTFSGDLFCPIGVHTVGLFVRKGTPHPLTQNVLWVRALNDGLTKSKGKRLPSPRAVNDYPAITDMLRAFIGNPAMPVEAVDRFQKACPIDLGDPFLELVPENYLDQAPPTPAEVQAGIDQVTRDAAAFLVRAGREGAIRHG